MNCLEKKNKTTELVSVKELLSCTKIGQNAFRIPDYQRGYSWSCNEQFADLWKDILRVYNNSDSNKKHYTGMLSLEEMDEKSKEKESLMGTNSFYVVDGQQRLTSIIIILKSLIEYIEVENNETLDNDLLSFDGVYRFDYSVDRDDEAKSFFTNNIYLDENSASFADMYLKNIHDAKEYMKSNLIKFNSAEAQEIINVVLNRLVFNIYFVVENFDVRVTFETMNNRGKKLSNLELLKNRLMYLSTFVGKTNVGNANYENRLKNSINNAWKNIYKNLCYQDRQLYDDEYLQAHWIVYGSLNKSKGDSYIRDILDEKFSVDEGKFYDLINKKQYHDAFSYIFDYVSSLEKYSKIWGIINNPLERKNYISSSEEVKWLDRLNRIGSFKYVKSTIMVLAGDNYLTSDQKVKAYRILERSLFLNKLIGQSKNDFSSIIKYARDLLKAKDDEKDKFYHQILSSIQSGEISMSDDNLKIALEKFSLYIKDKSNFMYSWDGINYFLYEYNDWLQISPNEKVIDWKLINNDSIEHILPQTPSRRYWQIVLSPLTNDEDKIRMVTNSLGNLLLLSKGENSSVQNYSYPVKKLKEVSSNRFAYIYGSRSAQKVALEHNDWTLQDIYNRETELFKFMYNRWIFLGSKITENEFLSLIASLGLSILKQPELSTLGINELHSLSFDDEQPEIKKEDKEDREWFNALRTYFDISRYWVRLNGRALSYVRDTFVFKRKGDHISCGIFDGDSNYRFSYALNEGVLKIERFNENERAIVSDQTQMAKCVNYFVDTFNRYLRRYCSKPDVVIFDESSIVSDEEKAKSQHYSEKEFLDKRSEFREMLELYKKLKQRIENKFNADPLYNQYFTDNYSAFNCGRNFAELHIRREYLTINMKDTGILSNLGRRLPDDSYNWPMMFQFSIRNEKQFDEAIRLISSSYEFVKSKK